MKYIAPFMPVLCIFVALMAVRVDMPIFAITYCIVGVFSAMLLRK